MKKKYLLKSWMLLTALAVSSNVIGQTKVGANSVDKSLGHVSNESNVLTDNYTTFANISSQTTLGLITTHGWLDFRYNNTIPANTNYYIRVRTNDNFLNNLLGGTVGGLLSSVLFGQHQLQVQVYNNSTTAFMDIRSNNFWTSGDPNPVNGNFNVWQAGDGFEYIKITPQSPFNRVRLRDRTNPGLVGANSIDVYYGYYYSSIDECEIPIFTSYTGTGGLLSVIQTAPVTNAYRAVDNDPTTYSTIGITSLLNVTTAGTVEQYFHLPKVVDDKSVKISMQLPTSLLNLAIAQQSAVVFYNNGVEVASTNIDESILGLDVLGLINTSDVTFSFATAPKDGNGDIIPYDRVGIRINIPVGLDLLGGSNIRVYDFAVINDKPVIQKVCTKEFINTVNGVDIRETKFKITDIIPQYNSANTYVVTNSAGASIDLSNPANIWQPLGSYVVRGITGSEDYCPNENVSILAVQDTRYQISGKTSISLPLDANDDGEVDAQYTFDAANYKVIDRGDLNTDVTNQYGPIQIFSEDDPTTNLMGTTVNFSQIGSYNYFVKTTNLNNTDCDLVRRVTIYVYDKADCEYRFVQRMADYETDQTITLLGIPLGGTSNSALAVDEDLSTHGSVFNVVSLLGIGTTSQKLMFTEEGQNKVIPAGTPVTVKLGQDYSLLEVIGGLTVQAVGTNGNTVGPLLSIGEIDLANILVGDNIIEFTFVPESNGVPIAYSGVQVNLGSVLGLGNSMRIYGAFIDERIPLADATCNPNIAINGAEIPGNLDASILLNTSTKDVMWGTQDIGLGVASLLSTTLYGYQAADAIDAPGTPLHGTPDFDTYAEFNAAVGALNQMSLTVKFKEIARPGDKVRLVMGREGNNILDANVLGSALTIQRYMGSTAIGEPVVVDGNALIQLDLLGLINPQNTGKYVYILDGIGAPFDRVEIRSGNLVTLELLSTKLRVYDVSLLPYFAFDTDDETTQLCTSVPFEIEKMDPCTSYQISYAYPTLDGDGNITAWNDIAGSQLVMLDQDDDVIQYRLVINNILKPYNEAGNLYMKVITMRQGCLYGDAQYLKVSLKNCSTIVNPMIRTRLKSN